MLFTSTRKREETASFQKAIFQGLAPDGGLYHQQSVPDLKKTFSQFCKDTPFTTIATEVTYALLQDELSHSDAGKIVREAFSFEPKLTMLDKQIDIMELYHGPSCAFKDFGASFLARTMSHFLANRQQHAVILTATSGDTGSAVAQAFYGQEHIDVVILYPSGRVSPLQEKQLTTLGGNVHALEVQGSFDDCQRMVKQAFMEKDLCSLIQLTSANSINLGRLLPQSFYYIWGRAQYAKTHEQMLKPAEFPLIFCVPSGNFGNLTAGVLAWSWGLQIDRFLAATNINDVVPEYLEKGLFTPRPSLPTLSNAMDVGNPSNFERLLAIFDNNREEMQEMIAHAVINDHETSSTIQSVYQDKGVFLDPHTAVGYLASRRYLENNPQSRLVCLSTAHPAKFSEVVEKATGTSAPLPAPLQALADKTKESTLIQPEMKDLKHYLLERFSGR